MFSWEQRKLGNLTQLITKGTTPKVKNIQNGINFIKVENISDDDFAKLLDEMENDPEGQGITIGEFIDSINQNILVSGNLIVNNEKNRVSYLFNTKSTTNTTNKNFLEAA